MAKEIEEEVAELKRELAEVKQARLQPHKTGRSNHKRIILFTVGAMICSLLMIVGTQMILRLDKKPDAPADIIPATVRSSVQFPIYYPDPAKLPSGYKLDTGSFSADSQAVVYTIWSDKGEKLVATIQQKPGEKDMEGFYSAHMPLHHEVVTSVGTAAIGEVNGQALVSLPTSGQSWVLITAPKNTNQDKLKALAMTYRK